MLDAERFVKELKKPELLKVAEYFGTEADEEDTKREIAERLVDDGVSWEDYELNFGESTGDEPTSEVTPNEVRDANGLEPLTEETQPVPEPEPTLVLVKMERGNPSYTFRNKRFTREHPYLVFPENEAAVILERPGFRVATPKEAADYYR